MNAVAAVRPPARARRVPRAAEGAAPAVHVPKGVRLVALLLWLVATALAWRFDWLRAYGDALSHEVIARRVFDSLNPGLAQLGTVWLPLPPLLLAPLSALDPIWRAGLAGALAGLVYLQLTVGALYRLGWFAGGPAGGLLAAGLFVANPNTLAFFVTPLTEAPALAFTSLAGAGVAEALDGFGHRQVRPAAIIRASVGAAGALLSRYDGWMLAGLAGLVLLAASYAWLRDRRLTEGISITYAVAPANAVALWLLYNLLVFGDALEFFRGTYASATIVADLAARGVIPTVDGRPPEVDNLGQTVLTYGQAVVENLGALPSLLAVAGLLAALLRARREPALLAPLVLTAPFLFYLLALPLGQSVIVTRAANPEGLFNVRYGAMVAPLVAVSVAALAPLVARAAGLGATLSASVRRRAGPARPTGPAPSRVSLTGAAAVWLVALASGASLLLAPGGPVVVAEGALQRRGASASFQAAAWLRDQPRDGLVLVDDALQPEAQIFFTEAGRPLRDYVGTSVPALWETALVQPRPPIAWIVVLGPASRDRPNDRVGGALLVGDRIQGYEVAFDNGELVIYRWAGGSASDT